MGRPTRNGMVVVLALATSLLAATWFSAHAFESATPLDALAVSQDTGEKPQSKAWTHDGHWWCVLPSSSASSAGTWLWKLEGTAWTEVLRLSTETGTNADVKAVGNVTHILLYDSDPALVSVEYVGGTYQLWSTRPTPSTVSLPDSETATIDIDSAGRMWVASESGTDIVVHYGDSPYSTWSGPVTLASGVNSDDISVVTALPNSTIGVLWSDQVTQRFGFRTHTDGADPATWSADEVPASQSALSVGGGMADDHLNVAVGSDGTLYAAVKTSYDTAGYPKIALLVRRPGGTWDNLYGVDESGTRGIALLNDTEGSITVIYTSSEGNNDIVYKETPTSAISFGSRTTLISGTNNNATSTKQNFDDEAVILASDGSTAQGVVVRALSLEDGLAGHWQMEEGSGTILLDSSLYGNDGTLYGDPGWVAGVDGLALDLDGAGDYALVPDDPSLDITDEITLAMWVRPRVVGPQYLVKKATLSVTAGYELSFSSSGKVFTRFNQASSGNDYRIDSVSSYPVDGTTWVHLAATYDGSDIRLYFNGVEEASAAATFSIAANTLALGIGAQSDGASQFNGSMDEARVYDRALTLTEIEELASATPDEADLWVTKDDGQTEALPGTAVTYTIVVGNDGPDGATGAAVTDNFPAGLAGVSWTTAVTGGASSTTGSGSGNIGDTVDLPNGSTVTYTVDATFDAGATGAVVNTASVDPPGGTTDPDLADNSATDSTWMTGTGDPDLVAQYAMEEGSGTALIASSLHGNDGTLYGDPGWVAGVDGLALDLDGAGDYALVPDDPSLDITDEITLAMWVRPRVVGTQYLVKKATISVTDGYELSLSATGKVFTRFNQASSANAYRIDSTTSYPADGTTWVHLAATYDGSDIRLYFNGVEEASAAATFSIAANALSLGIGAQSDGGTEFNGSMDEVGVYDRALTLTEIEELAGVSPGGEFALDFDGTNDYVTFGQASDLGVSTFTLECWFRRDGAGVTASTGSGGILAVPLVTKGRGESDASNLDMNYFLGIRGSDGVLSADYEEGAGQAQPGLNHPVVGVTPIRNNTWYHAAATFDGTTWTLYLNGQLETQLTVGAGRLPQSGSIQHAALASALNSGGTPAGYFNGVIDEARVWDYARTQAEVRSDMFSEVTSGTGLLGRWGLNEGSGTATVNSVAGGSNGTLTNDPLWVEGSPFALANGLDLGSSSGYVTFGNAPTLGLAAFTLECWFRRDGAGVTANTGDGGVLAVPLVTKGRGEGDASNLDMNYFLGIRGTDGVLAADFEEGAGGTSPGLNHPIVGVTPITTGEWHHAAVTYDGNEWRLYLDRMLEASLVVGQPPRSTSIQHAGLATALNSTGVASGHFDGVLDEVRIWNHARTLEEIEATINDEIGVPQSGLVARWGLNDGAGSTVHDSAGSAIDGAVTGTGWSWADGAPFDIYVGPPVPPAAPTDLVAAAVSYAEIGLAWTDNANNEDEFELERSTSGSGGPFDALATLDADATSYADGNVEPSTEYCYRLRAVNAEGASDWSSVACGTTLAETDHALDFGGTDAYVTFGQAPALGASQFTLECWFRRDGAGVTASTGLGGVHAVPLVTKGRGESDASNLDMNYFFGIRGTDGVLAADFEEGDGGTDPGLNHPIVGVTPITTGGWHHGAVTYDGNEWRLYLDGMLEASLVVGQPPQSASIQHAALASALDSAAVPEGYLDGVLDAVRIWSHARPLEEIRATINDAISTPASGLIGRWSLNEGAGTHVYGSAGTSVTGTIAGSNWAWTGGAPFDIVIVPEPPAAPTDLAASAASHAQIDLSWVDNANNEEDFELERSTSGSGGPFDALATVGANVTTYGDAGLEALTEYCYRGGAVNAEGASDWSNVICETTPGEGEFALDFGGTDAYVTFGAAPALGLAEFTLECWFRRDGAGVTASTGSGGVYAVPLVTKGRGEVDGSNLDMNYFCGIRGTDGVLAADFEEGDGGTDPGLNHPIVGVTPITTGGWHHAAVTYDGNEWRLYLDGVPEGSLVVGEPPQSASIQHAALASALTSTGTPEGYLDGVLDEVRIWSHARTLEEIRATINDAISTPQTGLVGRWDLNEGTGTAVSGSAGTSVDGTIVGSDWSWAGGAPFDIVIVPEPPAAPSDLAAAAVSHAQIDLSWVDNANNEEDFELERSTSGSGGPFGSLATVGANVTTYSDAGLEALTEYCYRVRAVNADGASDWSSVACETTPAEGEFALDFGGTDAYVTFGAAPELGVSEFTIECWFRRDGAGGTASTGSGGVYAVPLVTKGRGEVDASNLDMNYFFGIRGTDGVLAADFEEGSGGSSPGQNHPIVGVTPITTGGWHHGAVTYDGSEWRLYLDGVLEGTPLVIGEPPQSASIQHAALASALTSSGTPEGYLDGVLDEVRIWSHARTLSEIRARINDAITTPESGLIGRWSLNEGTGTAVSGSAGTTVNGTIMGSNWAWAGGAPFDIVINDPPDEPVLNAPADYATGVSTSPTLDVTVSDPEGDPMSVTFYGRANTGTVGPAFSLIIIPDTQFYSAEMNGGTPAIFEAQTQWIVDNKDVLNIAYVDHVGDIVQNGDTYESEWVNAWSAMGTLEDTIATGLPDGIPYSATVGNHDQSPGGDPAGTTTYYNQYFGVDHFNGRPYYGSHYGSNNDNHYSFFSASGLDFIAITMEYDTSPDAGVLAWADGLLAAYPNRWGIISVHYLIGTGNPATFSSQGQATYNALKDNPNLFLMVCGHVVGEGRRSDTYLDNTVHTLLADYQGRSNGGDGWLRIMTVRPESGVISVKTYSPTLDLYEADADSSSQFTLPCELVPLAEWQVIGTVAGVTSGSSATIDWPGLSTLTSYDWYAEATDGNSVSAGPVWHFTTLSGDPSVAVVYPNGGETLNIGASASLEWSATDDVGVTSVDLLLSRTGVGGSYEAVATGLANTGLFDWTVSGPESDNAFLKAVVYDGDANTSEDVSDAAFTIVDPTGVPEVTAVHIANLALAHTDDYAKDTDNLELTATVTDNSSLVASDITADFSTLLDVGGTDVPAESYSENIATWTTALANVALASDGPKTVTITATDGFGYAGTGSDTIVADNTPPTSVTEFSAASGHEVCELIWTEPEDAQCPIVGVSVASLSEGEYPTYATFVADWPDVDGHYPADHTSGTEVYSGTGTSYTHAVSSRDIYFYRAFSYDEARNYAPAGPTSGDCATNYWLGDVANAENSWIPDGNVFVADFAKLSGTYGSAPSDPDYETCDVGPTDDHSRVGVPLPDDALDFEDLMIFSMNYDVVSPRVVPFLPSPEATHELALSVEERSVAPSGEVELSLVLSGNSDEVKGLSSVLTYDAAELGLVSARLSEEMSSPLGDVFFWHRSEDGRVQMDLAVLGTGVTVGGSGEVAVLTFVVLSDEYAVGIESANLRGAENRPLEADLEGFESRPELPTVFRLVQNAPNPFNPVTKIAYHVPRESGVSIRIYDVSGRLVRTLVDCATKPGRHLAVWDGRNDSGESVGSGVYFCTMEAPDFRSSQKMMLLK